MSLVRPRLVQRRYPQRVLIEKMQKHTKFRRFLDFPILGPILGHIFPLWAARFLRSLRSLRPCVQVAKRSLRSLRHLVHWLHRLHSCS